MTAIVSAIAKGEPIPVAVVADAQELDKQDQADTNGEVEINTQTGPLRKRQRMLMDMAQECCNEN